MPPFSFVATAVLFRKVVLLLVDIDEAFLNIDAAKVEAAITDKTVAILATHVYGNRKFKWNA